MSTTKKVLLRVLPIVLVLIVVATNSVFGFDKFSADMTIDSGETQGINSANAAVGRAWNTVILILQILAVAAVVFAGVRYMFASADAKADIKKGSLGLIVGAILVFGATFVIDFVVNVTKEVTDTKGDKPSANVSGGFTSSNDVDAGQ